MALGRFSLPVPACGPVWIAARHSALHVRARSTVNLASVRSVTGVMTRPEHQYERCVHTTLTDEEIAQTLQEAFRPHRCAVEFDADHTRVALLLFVGEGIAERQ